MQKYSEWIPTKGDDAFQSQQSPVARALHRRTSLLALHVSPAPSPHHTTQTQLGPTLQSSELRLRQNELVTLDSVMMMKS